MATVADVVELLDHPRRRAIACAALEAPQTVGEIAHRIDAADGAIRPVVERMARDGLLVASERPGRGKRSPAVAYQVASDYVHHVSERCRGDDSPPLGEGEELLLVPLGGLSLAAGVLAREKPEVIRWAARTRDPQISLMLGLRPGSPPAGRDRLFLALRDQGVDCVRVHVGEPLTPGALFEYATDLLAGDARSLPSGE